MMLYLILKENKKKLKILFIAVSLINNAAFC